MEVLVALSNLAENCRFLKKHTESDCIMARVAFLRTLHHVQPAAPDGAAATVQGPKVWQVFEDGAWKDGAFRKTRLNDARNTRYEQVHGHQSSEDESDSD